MSGSLEGLFNVQVVCGVVKGREQKKEPARRYHNCMWNETQVQVTLFNVRVRSK